MELKEGDLLSEVTKYKVTDSTLYGRYNQIKCKNLGDGSDIYITESYLKKTCKFADYFDKTEKVTKDNKKDGTLGIRSIFESIPENIVFTVVFKKQDTAKTNKALNEEIEAKTNEIAERLTKVKKSRKGVLEAAIGEIRNIIKNPISDHNEGELRTLRGWKLETNSIDGKYKCIDADIADSNNIRLVNINTIQELIYNGVKYTL